MKNFAPIILLLLLATSCKKELVFEQRTFEKKTSLPCNEQCPQITVKIPVAKGGVAADSINKKVFSTLSNIIDFGEKPSNAKTYDELLTSFIASYEKLQKDAPEDVFGWEGDVKGQIIFKSDKLLNIEIKHYTFTGGAHGYSGVRSLIFDPNNGKSIAPEKLFKNVTGFKKFAEQKFREKYGLLGKPINSNGLMFENDKFQLPQNILITSDGILLYYNAYEIASYAAGAQELLLPYEVAGQFLVVR